MTLVARPPAVSFTLVARSPVLLARSPALSCPNLITFITIAIPWAPAACSGLSATGDSSSAAGAATQHCKHAGTFNLLQSAAGASVAGSGAPAAGSSSAGGNRSAGRNLLNPLTGSPAGAGWAHAVRVCRAWAVQCGAARLRAS
eukprot:7382925-Prymnesium_polylepis.1